MSAQGLTRYKPIFDIEDNCRFNDMQARPDGQWYRVVDVDALRTQALELAKHLERYPYGHNADGCLEYRDEIKQAAQRFREEWGHD